MTLMTSICYYPQSLSNSISIILAPPQHIFIKTASYDHKLFFPMAPKKPSKQVAKDTPEHSRKKVNNNILHVYRKACLVVIQAKSFSFFMFLLLYF